MFTNPVSTHLQEKLKAKIATIAATAHDLPGVVIVHDLRDWSVAWMCERGLQLLGVSLQEVKAMTSEEYHDRFFNTEDAKDYVPQILGLLERNNLNDNISFFQQVRFAGVQDWHWHLSSIKIAMRDEAGEPLLTVTFSIRINAMHHMTAKAERLLAENNFIRKHFHEFAKLSRREHDILRYLALGKSSLETGEILHISMATVETHRKNIKNKLNTNSFYDLCLYARAFDLI